MQETKAQPDQVPSEVANPEGYNVYWASAEKKGYSGVAVFSKEEPVSVSQMGIDRFDVEGRLLQLEYRDYLLITAYFPNSQSAGKRLDYHCVNPRAAELVRSAEIHADVMGSDHCPVSVILEI